MYSQNKSRLSGRNNSSVPGYGQRSYSSSRRSSFQSFGGGGFRGGRTRHTRSRFADNKIDVSRYINTHTVQEKVVPYVPKHTFADFQIHERLKENIIQKGYITPTPIQDQAIPEILAGKDIVGIANTGTGKTAAFLIPLIHKVMMGDKEQVLIIAPTRELAQQINDEFNTFRGTMNMYSVCLVGGAPIGTQIRQLRYFNHFVIGTPGRIKDLIERKCLDVSKFNTIVLDEADRMLDMGFVNDMRFVVSNMPSTRHTLFFSATISPEVEKLIKDFLKDPVRITLKTGDTSKNVLQDVVRVERGQSKVDVLHDLLQDKAFEKVIVFGKTKHGVQNLSDALNARGHVSSAIHGNKNQTQRQRALLDFKNHKSKILVATDVAARGLDIPNVSHVINFDIPATHEDYIHRIGRTGRGDNKGKALTFVD